MCPVGEMTGRQEERCPGKRGGRGGGGAWAGGRE